MTPKARGEARLVEVGGEETYVALRTGKSTVSSMSWVARTAPWQFSSGMEDRKMDEMATDVVIRLSQPMLFEIGFCIAMAALLAVLILGCDDDGNLRAK